MKLPSHRVVLGFLIVIIGACDRATSEPKGAGTTTTNLTTRLPETGPEGVWESSSYKNDFFRPFSVHLSSMWSIKRRGGTASLKDGAERPGGHSQATNRTSPEKIEHVFVLYAEYGGQVPRTISIDIWNLAGGTVLQFAKRDLDDKVRQLRAANTLVAGPAGLGKEPFLNEECVFSEAYGRFPSAAYHVRSFYVPAGDHVLVYAVSFGDSQDRYDAVAMLEDMVSIGSEPTAEAERSQVVPFRQVPFDPTKELTLDLGSGITMQLMPIPAGEFVMGSPESEEGRDRGEGPQHRVRISEPFLMGKYEVTQAQWQAVMGNNPSFLQGDGNLPVEKISWDDCQDFCRKLSTKTGHMVRLPTEAEWEYACRAGSTGKYCHRDSEGKLGTYGWYDANSDSKTHPVGQKKPNAWGLCDMHGNVCEWCADWLDKYPGSSARWHDFGQTHRVLRGGSWDGPLAYCRSASRGGLAPSIRCINIGLRVAAGDH